MDDKTAQTSRRIATAKRWLDAKTSEAQQGKFFGELTITLRFEGGQCVLNEQLVRETVK